MTTDPLLLNRWKKRNLRRRRWCRPPAPSSSSLIIFNIIFIGTSSLTRKKIKVTYRVKI
ncbi:hypothetical protein HanPSC8_Chr02g0059391 [Helianthus annuus]|nr:hypothetical protein HanPSC8_Chr02g0059391 [Helianthus annuus]